MKNVTTILFLIVIVAISSFFITKEYFCSSKVKVKTEINIDTVYKDTGSIQWKEPAPKITYRDTGSIDTVKINKDLDSAEIAKKYQEIYREFHTKNIYNDTIKDDTNALIVIRDTVYRNKLQQRRSTYKDRTPTVVKNEKKVYNRRKFYVGVEGGRHTLKPSVMYHTKKGWNIGLGYDFIGEETGLRLSVHTTF